MSRSTIPTLEEEIEFDQKLKAFELNWSQWCGFCGKRIRDNDYDIYLVQEIYYHGCCIHFLCGADGKTLAKTRKPN